jgi:hypothetical protein
MRLSFNQLWKLSVLGLFAVFARGSHCAEVVPYGASWRYLVGLSEASSPDSTAWRKPGFDDSAWSVGAAPIGYANPPNSAPEFTIATFVPSSLDGNYSCVFARSTFLAKNPTGANTFTVNVNIDDGCIVWINGAEVGRYNLPDGELAYNQWALTAGEATLTQFTIKNSAQGPVVAGTNVIAVQVFNANATSSDLFFDLSLESDLDETPPSAISTDPTGGATVSELSHIDVVFSENVSGVDAADLLINGAPASGINTISPREYVFQFPLQPNGTVNIAWAPNHGITDLSGNPFTGGSWSYTVKPADRKAAVIISEFLAENSHGVKDEDGDRSDWIELLNTSSSIANLEGWFLTDDPANLTKWPFPAITLDTGSYLLLFASGKNRTNTTAPLHTNFKLEKGGGYLALINPETNRVSEFVGYPAQRADISYGRDPSSPEPAGYLTPPTPGAVNVQSGAGFSPEVIVSLAGGVYTNNVLSVSLTTTAGQIHYTTDGSVPTAASSLYTAPISVSASRAVKARSFQAGLLPGPVAEANYILVDSSVANFTSNLPLLILSTGGKSVGQDITPRTHCSMVAIDTFRGRSSVLGKPEFIGQGGIEERGQSSTGFPKVQYNFSFENPSRQQENVGLFGLPADDDWALYAPYSDKPFLQNFIAYELYEKMGRYSVRRRFVEVFLDTNGGKISYNSDYVGIYILVEKIRIDKNRVDLDRLTPYNTTEPDISGGYMFKKDKDSPGDYNFSTTGNASAGFSAQALKLHQPKPVQTTTAQKAWLRNYLAQMEKALYAPNWKTATGTNHWSYYIDADSFVDFQWIVEFAKQIDGYRLSNYFYKPRNGKVHMSPIWDWNLSFGNADYLDGANTSNWYWQECSENEHIWLRRLMCGTPDSSGTTGDPDFKQRVTDRWSELRTNILSSTNVIARAQELASTLNEAATRDFQRWPRLGSYVWPNPPLYSTPTTYAGIMQSFTNWVKGRYTWIDSQFLPVPTMDLPGGLTRPGSALTLGGSGGGAIYYTTDGRDPRLPGGALSPQALRYTAPVLIQANSKVFARRLNGSTWSGPSVRSFAVQKPTLAISEIMYHPVGTAGTFSESDFEFVEFQNTGSVPLPLEGITISGGIQFTFPAATLDPGAYITVVKSVAAFQLRYGATPRIAGEFTGSLSNTGDTIVVTGPLGEPIAQVHFKDGWYPLTDGAGFSLARRIESGETDLNDPASWQASAVEGGSPGAPESSTAEGPNVVISEILARPTGTAVKAIELQNLAALPADLTGWYLTDDVQKPREFMIAAGTVVSANGFVVLPGNQFGTLLNPAGGNLYLISADGTGRLSGYLHAFKYGASPENVTIGRLLDRAGGEHFVLQQTPSLGQPNTGAWEAPIIISEVMYHPPDVIVNNLPWNDTEDEFIELINRSAQAVPLYDAAFPTNTWRIDGGVTFQFPPNQTLAPGALALVVNFDPITDTVQSAAFRAKYSVPGNVALFGPYKGNLGNDSNRISLQAPASPLGTTGEAPYYVEAEIEYSNRAPWNAGADGLGFSLTRLELAGYGNDPTQWTAASPTAGSWSQPAGAPVISVQPKTQFGIARSSLSLNVQAGGAGSLSYQWLHSGAQIQGATTAMLNLVNLSPINSGEYTVVVSSPTAAVTSQPAFVTVQIDSDGDGMPDDWEFTYGLNPFDPSDATQDSDGDGFSNRDEYIAGTNPRSAQSVLNLTPTESSTVRFFAAPSRSYSVLYADSLTSPVWRKLTDIPAAAQGTDAVVQDAAPAPQRFYRLVTPAQ